MNSSFHSFRRLPRAAQVFLLSEFFFGFASGVISLNLNFHLNARSLDNYMIGTLGMVGSAASAACSLTAGFLSDRMGNHSIVVGGSFIQGLGFFITAFSPNLPGLFLGQILQSMGSACVRTCEFPYVTALAETAEQKQNVYFLLIYSYSISNIAGTLIGGFLPKWFQRLPLPGSSGNPYMLPVLLGGLSYGIMGVFRLRLIHDKPDKRPVQRDKSRWLETLAGGDGRVIWYMAFQVFYHIGNALGGAQLNLVIKNRFGLSDQAIGTLMSVSSVLTVATLTMLPMLMGRFSNTAIARVMIITIACSYGVNAIPSAPVFILMMMVRAFFVQFYGMVFEQPMLVSVRETGRGAYSGMRLCFSALGEAVGTWTAGYFLSYLTYPLLMTVTVCVFAIVFFIYQKCRRFLGLQPQQV